MSMERLPFEHRPRNSIANNLDRINELVDWVNLDTHLYASASGERVTADDASSVKGLTVDGRSVQDGTPTPDAPVPVQVVEGRNLLTSGFENGIYNSTTGLPTSSNAYARSRKTAVAPSTEYTISFEKFYEASSVYLYEWDASDTFLGKTNLGSGSTTTYVKTFTTRATTSFVAFSCGASQNQEQANTIKKSQLEAGSTATPYTPYGSIGIVVGDTATSIDLQGNKLASLPDNTRDELHVDCAGRVWIKKNVGKTTIDDNLVFGSTFTNSSTMGGNCTRITMNMNNFPTMKSVALNTTNSYMSIAVAGTTAASAAPNPGFYSKTATSGVYLTLPSTLTSASDVTAWLTANNFDFLYPLAEATTIDLGYIDPPAIPSGSVVTVSASLTPTIHLEWWVDDGITALVDDLITYVDHKTEG